MHWEIQKQKKRRKGNGKSKANIYTKGVILTKRGRGVHKILSSQGGGGGNMVFGGFRTKNILGLTVSLATSSMNT